MAQSLGGLRWFGQRSGPFASPSRPLASARSCSQRWPPRRAREPACDSQPGVVAGSVVAWASSVMHLSGTCWRRRAVQFSHGRLGNPDERHVARTRARARALPGRCVSPGEQHHLWPRGYRSLAPRHSGSGTGNHQERQRSTATQVVGERPNDLDWIRPSAAACDGTTRRMDRTVQTATTSPARATRRRLAHRDGARPAQPWLGLGSLVASASVRG